MNLNNEQKTGIVIAFMLCATILTMTFMGVSCEKSRHDANVKIGEFTK